MTNPRTKYTEEYRRETADYIISTGRPVAAIAAELGLHQKTAARWVTARKKVLNGDVPSPERNDELKAAQKRIRELEMENSFLKKAAAFFAKEQG
ncbi:MAG: transposase [Bacteroides sp.]